MSNLSINSVKDIEDDYQGGILVPNHPTTKRFSIWISVYCHGIWSMGAPGSAGFRTIRLMCKKNKITYISKSYNETDKTLYYRFQLS